MLHFIIMPNKLKKNLKKVYYIVTTVPLLNICSLQTGITYKYLRYSIETNRFLYDELEEDVVII